MGETKLHYRACNLCEALCGLEIEYQGNEIIAIRGDKNDPFSKGHICPKATALEDVYKDPDRLKRPVPCLTPGLFLLLLPSSGLSMFYFLCCLLLAQDNNHLLFSSL